MLRLWVNHVNALLWILNAISNFRKVIFLVFQYWPFPVRLSICYVEILDSEFCSFAVVPALQFWFGFITLQSDVWSEHFLTNRIRQEQAKHFNYSLCGRPASNRRTNGMLWRNCPLEQTGGHSPSVPWLKTNPVLGEYFQPPVFA